MGAMKEESPKSTVKWIESFYDEILKNAKESLCLEHAIIPDGLIKRMLEEAVLNAYIEEHLIITFIADAGGDAIIVEEYLSDIVSRTISEGWEVDLDAMATALETLAGEIREKAESG
jgi:hypothetical protein